MFHFTSQTDHTLDRRNANWACHSWRNSACTYWAHIHVHVSLGFMFGPEHMQIIQLSPGVSPSLKARGWGRVTHTYMCTYSTCTCREFRFVNEAVMNTRIWQLITSSPFLIWRQSSTYMYMYMYRYSYHIAEILELNLPDCSKIEEIRNWRFLLAFVHYNIHVHVVLKNLYVEFNLVVFLWNRQSAKFKSPPIFPAIQYIQMYCTCIRHMCLRLSSYVHVQWLLHQCYSVGTSGTNVSESLM